MKPIKSNLAKLEKSCASQNRKPYEVIGVSAEQYEQMSIADKIDKLTEKDIKIVRSAKANKTYNIYDDILKNGTEEQKQTLKSIVEEWKNNKEKRLLEKQKEALQKQLQKINKKLDDLG